MTLFVINLITLPLMERQITPPLKNVITLPVYTDSNREGVVIYIGQSAFCDRDNAELVAAVALELFDRYSLVGAAL